MTRHLVIGLFLLTRTGVLAQPPAAPAPALSNEEQDRVLGLMHEYADKYASNLPNFICDQVTRESEADVEAKHWKKGDTVVSKLSFHDGREDRSVESVNGKKVKAGGKEHRLFLNTQGEFGMLLTQVLGKESQAFFKWTGWDTVRGKRLAVYDFSVDRERSTLSLHMGDVAGATVGYEGSVDADPETGAVWRIVYTAKDIPKQIQTRKISTTVDYAQTDIGTKSYLLPTQATVTLLTWLQQVRNELEFKGYRKFDADTVIKFDSGDPPK